MCPVGVERQQDPPPSCLGVDGISQTLQDDLHEFGSDPSPVTSVKDNVRGGGSLGRLEIRLRYLIAMQKDVLRQEWLKLGIIANHTNMCERSSEITLFRMMGQ